MGVRGPRRRRPRGGPARGRRGPACGCWTSTPRCTPTRTTASPTPCCGSCTTCSTRPRWSRSSTRSSAASGRRTARTTRAFAEALAEEAAEGASVLVQDYHLCLVPGMLRVLRPDLRIGHFSHTPWAPVDYFRMLPDDIRAELLDGMLGADRLAFLTWRWATAFLDCAAELDRARPGGPGLGDDPRRSSTWTAPRPAGPASACTASARTRSSCATARTRTTSPSGWPRCARRSARAAGRSCASTGPSCRRTSCAGCWPTGSCSTTIRSGASAWCTWRSPTPRGRTSRSTGTTPPRCSGSPRRSTPATGRRAGPRSCCT